MTQNETQSPVKTGWELRRRTLLTLIAPTVGAGLLAACSPAAPAAPAAQSAAPTGVPQTGANPSTGASASPAAGASPVAAASPVAQGKPGGSFKVGQIGDIARLDGQLYSATDTTWMPYDRLTAYDEKLQPQPMLAESWEVSADFREIKLNLRKGVTFHSGREFTSEDVKWNVQYVRSPKVAAGALVQQANWFTSVETPDKYTAILKSDKPRPMTFDFFEFFDIVDREAAEGPAPESKSVGTGPFVFKEWVQGDRLVFTRNKNYWRPNRPYLDEVVVQIMRDAQTMVTSLEAGVLDAALAPPVRDYDRLSKNSNYRALTVTASTNVIGANTTLPPTNNKFVRQAINYAIDRKRMTDSVYLGVGEAKSLIWGNNSPAWELNKVQHYAYDLDKARALLAQSGLTNIAFDIVLNQANAENPQVAQILQGDLDKIGIKASIKPYDSAGYLDQVNNHKYTGVYIGGVAYISASPVTIIANSRHLDPLGNSNTGYTSPEYVELYNTAATEPDADKRKALYSRLNDLFLDVSAVMPITAAPRTMLTRSTIHDVMGSAHGTFIYNDAWRTRNEAKYRSNSHDPRRQPRPPGRDHRGDPEAHRRPAS